MSIPFYVFFVSFSLNCLVFVDIGLFGVDLGFVVILVSVSEEYSILSSAPRTSKLFFVGVNYLIIFFLLGSSGSSINMPSNFLKSALRRSLSQSSSWEAIVRAHRDRV